jgi:hypothetical protein
MYQPRTKLEFVKRYCSPREGWAVFVDLDASEEGRTGGKRKSTEAVERQQSMQEDASEVRKALCDLSVTVGGSRKVWAENLSLPFIEGDRDIIAFHTKKKVVIVAEVEGESSGQPEQKLYKAIGQIVMTAGIRQPREWKRQLVLVVCGQKIAEHLKSAKALAKLGVSAVVLSEQVKGDTWVFGNPDWL